MNNTTHATKNNRNIRRCQEKINENSKIVFISSYKKRNIVKPYIKTDNDWFKISRADNPAVNLSAKATRLLGALIYKLHQNSDAPIFAHSDWFKTITFTDRKQNTRICKQLSHIFNFKFCPSIRVNNLRLFNVYEISYTENAFQILNFEDVKNTPVPLRIVSAEEDNNVSRGGHKCPTPTIYNNNSLRDKNDDILSSFFISSNINNKSTEEEKESNVILYPCASLFNEAAQGKNGEKLPDPTPHDQIATSSSDTPFSPVLINQNTSMTDSNPVSTSPQHLTETEKTPIPIPDILKQLISGERGEKIFNSLRLYTKGNDQYSLEIDGQLTIDEEEKDKVRMVIKATYGEHIRIVTKKSAQFLSPVESFYTQIRSKATGNGYSLIQQKDMKYDITCNCLSWKISKFEISYYITGDTSAIRDFVSETGVTVKLLERDGSNCWQTFTKQEVDMENTKMYEFHQKFLRGETGFAIPFKPMMDDKFPSNRKEIMALPH